MEGIDTSNPAEAIRAAVEADSASAQQTDQAPQSVEQPVSPEVDGGATQDDSLFKNIDPSTLTPEFKSLYDSLNKDYTQKMQALSEQRKVFDSLGDQEQVRNAVEFVQSLQDPANLIQLQTELSDYLQTQGYSKATADESAAQTIQSTDQETSFNDFEESNPQLEALKKELNEVKSFREEYEQQRLQAEIETSLARTENVIRQANPTYNDSDIESIYQRSYAFGGDLMAAQKAYEGERQRILSAYVDAKTQIPAALAPVPVGSGAEQPAKFNSFDEAHQYAKRLASAIDGGAGS